MIEPTMTAPKDDTKIKLGNVTVCYDITTPADLSVYGYSIMPAKIDYDDETNMMMCGLAYSGRYIGEALFFDTDRKLNIKELANTPISQILLLHDGEINLGDITVYFNKTTPADLSIHGYSIIPEEIEYHSERNLMMCGLAHNGRYIGEIVFYETDGLFDLKELVNMPINWIVLNDDINNSEADEELDYQENLVDTEFEVENKKVGNGFWDFLEMNIKTKSGRKDIKVLLIFYGVLLLTLFVGGKEIPQELTYIALLFPVAFFGIAAIYWLIQKFFFYSYNRLPLAQFVLLCAAILLLWNLLVSILDMSLRNLPFASKKDLINVWILCFTLIICFPVFLIIGYKWVSGKVPKEQVRYMIYNVIILVPFIFLMLEQNIFKTFIEINTFGTLYCKYLYINYFWYCTSALLIIGCYGVPLLIDIISRKRTDY